MHCAFWRLPVRISPRDWLFERWWTSKKFRLFTMSLVAKSTNYARYEVISQSIRYSRIIPEKIILRQSRNTAFYTTLSFIAVFIITHNSSPFWTTSKLSTASYTTSLILSYNTCLNLKGDLFPSFPHQNHVCIFPSFSTCPAHITLTDFITIVVPDTAQYMQFHIRQFSPGSCHFLILHPNKYLAQ